MTAAFLAAFAHGGGPALERDRRYSRSQPPRDTGLEKSRSRGTVPKYARWRGSSIYRLDLGGSTDTMSRGHYA